MSADPRAVVRLRWLTREEGGRVSPPTGPQYAATARFAAPSLAGYDFGVMLDLAPDGQRAALRLLSAEDVPLVAEGIEPGARLRILEGARVVAEAEVQYVADPEQPRG